MMTPEQRTVVRQVYIHLLGHENRGWDELDDFVDYLEFLTEDELYRECDALYSTHSGIEVRCHQKHDKKDCLIPLLIEAVAAILELYREAPTLHAKNKYILHYYLAMYQANMIVVDGKSVKP